LPDLNRVEADVLGVDGADKNMKYWQTFRHF
jgi:hypothetical protein